MNNTIEHKFPSYSVKNINNKKAFLLYGQNTYLIQNINNPLIFKNIPIDTQKKFIISFINSLQKKEKYYKVYKDFIFYDTDNLISITKKYSQLSIKKIGISSKNLQQFINMDICNIRNLNIKLQICHLPQYFSIDILKNSYEAYDLFTSVEYNIYNILSTIERDYRIYHFNINKEEELDKLVSIEREYLNLKKYNNYYFKLIDFLRQQIDNTILYYIYITFHFLSSISIYNLSNLKKKYFFLLSTLYLENLLKK